MSGVLYNLNIPLIRVLEGYPGQDSWIGQVLKRRLQTEFSRDETLLAGLRTLRLRLEKPDPTVEKVFGDIGKARYWNWPTKRGLVLPTRLGNAIRNFEDYPNQQYGIDDVALWPRLIAKVGPGYSALIDDAKTAFDFMVNSSILSALLSASIVASELIYPSRLFQWDWSVPGFWIPEALALTFLSYFFYRKSVGRAQAWGALVKSAFDLYRWDLLRELGYKQSPVTRKEEKELWGEITRRIIYGKHPIYPDIDYVSSRFTVTPEYVSLQISRGVKPPQDATTLVVMLSAKNTDEHGQDAKDVVLIDWLPDGFEYEWGSVAASSGTSVTVNGTNPYRFHIGPLASGQERQITYRLIRRGSITPE